jgi:peptidoglycan L-alanyl-D-glutamate endopeptidase CwlK
MSHLISTLEPNMIRMCNAHIAACAAADITLVVYNTRRTEKEQALLYANGRLLDELPDSVAQLIAEEIREWESHGAHTGPGNIVTHCHGPECPHVLGIAYDAVPVENGDAIWSDNALWEKIGAIGESVGLDWGGRYKTIRDRPHFQRKA